ncbi:hypothetical protein C0993_011216 [Termitomyces sp. T159_Od127]|nr:hypothetical protein C0993_011216 [Termitomyces sp. T159_Od127]
MVMEPTARQTFAWQGSNHASDVDIYSGTAAGRTIGVARAASIIAVKVMSDEGNKSPARAPGAICVGASNIADARASFSNYGSVVTLFAPGENILSAWYTGPTASEIVNIAVSVRTKEIQATPLVSGLVASLISSKGRVSPATMRTNLKNLSVKGVLTNIRNLAAGTANQLAQNGLAPK